MADSDIKAKIVAQCRQEFLNGLQFKQGRIKDWQGNEDLYFNRVKKTLRGRFNVPIPIMSGFVDTLLSKIDEPPSIKFTQNEEADLRISQKTQALYEVESKNEDADWASKDLDAKKLAILYGRAIFRAYGESDPKYKFNLFVTDIYDFIADPMGGGDLENHRFVAEDNIFKSKYELLEGAKIGIYDKSAVFKLVNNVPEQTLVNNETLYQNKQNRFTALGLTSQMHNFVGDGMIKFVEQGTTYHGERYYVLYEYASGHAVRCEKLTDIFESNLWWWTSWATHRDAFNFWSKAPADDIRPVAEAIRILVNQELDNRQKRNWNQRAYDPDVFPNASELPYRPDGLVATRAGASKVQNISNGIFTFETPELNGTINLVDWMDGIIGQKSGVTGDTQGKSDEDKVGIYYGNLQQVADRLGLYNKSYAKCHAAIGRRYVWALHEHLTKPMAVRLIGEKGVEWDTLTKKEVNPNLNITIEGGNAQLQADEVKKKQQLESILAIKSDPNLAGVVNKTWMVENLLRGGQFSDEEIRVALDTENNGSRELLAEASESIQEIIEGKQPKLNRGATTAFQQKILDFAMDNTDDDIELFNRLTAYSAAHDEIVMENMSRKAMQVRAAQGAGIPAAAPSLDKPNIADMVNQPVPSEMPTPQPAPALV